MAVLTFKLAAAVCLGLTASFAPPSLPRHQRYAPVLRAKSQTTSKKMVVPIDGDEAFLAFAESMWANDDDEEEEETRRRGPMHVPAPTLALPSPRQQLQQANSDSDWQTVLNDPGGGGVTGAGNWPTCSAAGGAEQGGGDDASGPGAHP